MDLYQWRNKGKDTVCYKNMSYCSHYFLHVRSQEDWCLTKSPGASDSLVKDGRKPILSMCSASRETQFFPFNPLAYGVMISADIFRTYCWLLEDKMEKYRLGIKTIRRLFCIFKNFYPKECFWINWLKLESKV